MPRPQASYPDHNHKTQSAERIEHSEFRFERYALSAMLFASKKEEEEDAKEDFNR